MLKVFKSLLIADKTVQRGIGLRVLATVHLLVLFDESPQGDLLRLIVLAIGVAFVCQDAAQLWLRVGLVLDCVKQPGKARVHQQEILVRWLNC